MAASGEKKTSAWDAPEPWRTDRFQLETSVYTKHYNYDPEHNDDQNLLLGEWNITEQWLVGAALFDNSFGQPTQYVYGGYRFRPLSSVPPFYFKVGSHRVVVGSAARCHLPNGAVKLIRHCETASRD